MVMRQLLKMVKYLSQIGFDITIEHCNALFNMMDKKQRKDAKFLTSKGCSDVNAFRAFTIGDLELIKYHRNMDKIMQKRKNDSMRFAHNQ